MSTDSENVSASPLRNRMRNRVIAAGAVGLIALGAMLFQGLPGFGNGKGDGDSSTDSDSKTKSDDESNRVASYGDVVTIRVIGEAYEVRETFDGNNDNNKWRPIKLDEITALVNKSKGNQVGVRVRYYVNDSAVFDAEDILRRTLEAAVPRSAISAINSEGR